MRRRSLGPVATEDLTMFTRTTNDTFVTRLVTSLVIAATLVLGTLGYAAANIQIVA